MDLRRSTLYQCLAEALAEPPDWLALPGQNWLLFEAVLTLSRESAAARQAAQVILQIDAEPVEARRSRYARVFAGSPGGSIGLYESGALHGKLLGLETSRVEQWYYQAGLSIDGAELPDHASLELAFLSFLSGYSFDDLSSIEAAFLQQHAGRWLPALGRAIAASGDEVYGPIGSLLAGWMEEVCDHHKVPGSNRKRKVSSSHQKGHLPYLIDTEACTLCGFCVQACPTGSLSILENDYSTNLFLGIDRCISCSKCVQICPMSVLAVGASPDTGQQVSDQKRLLRSSDRAICKGCGAPMISQAELDYVADRLGDPDWLAYCQSCR